MGEETVLQEFIADIEPYIAQVEDGVHAAQEFAAANREADSAIKDMRDSAAEDALAERELATAIHEVRDALLEQAAAAAIARDETKNAAQAIDSGGGRSGLVGALVSLLSFLGPGGGTGSGGVIGALSALGPVLLAAAAAAATLAFAGLFPILAVLPLIAVGIGGFAAVAVPEITKVWHALSVGGSAWAKLSPQEKAAGRELRDLRGEFERLSHAVQPEILTAFDEALKILKDVMPALRPLVVAAGHALDTLLQQIDHWLKSGSGQKFIQWMKVDGVGAIKAFGEFLWGLISVLGRTFSFLFNFGETVHHVFDVARHDAAAWADHLHSYFDTARHTVASWGHDIAHTFDGVRGAIHSFFTAVGSHFTVFTQFWRQHSAEIEQVTKAAWTVIKTTIEVVLKSIVLEVRAAWALIGPFIIAGLHVLEAAWHVAWAIIGNVLKTAWQVYTEIVSGAIHLILNTIAVVLDLITGHWSKAWHDLEHLTSDALHTIRSIIISLTSGFGTLLFDAGRALITGLINGIKSMFGALGSVAGSIAHFISGLKGPIDYDRALLIPHGQAIMHGLMAGIRSQLPALRGLLGDVTSAVGGPGVPGLAAAGAAAGAGAGAGGGGGVVINLGGITVNGWVGNDQQLVARFQEGLLEHGILNPTAGVWPLAKGRIR